MKIKEEYAEVDEGELLVHRKVLSGQKVSNCEEKCENVFHTRCITNGHVGSFIVDGGS